MERRNYLLALALPALLAACTQDELMTENANNDGLKLVENPIENFNLKVNVAEDVQTRVNTAAEWQVGDQMGLVWFNPYYVNGDQTLQLIKPQFYANNRMTISDGGSGTGVWTSDAVIMEGQHFAYFPFQTVWGEDYLQVKGGKEILKVYNTADQKDDVNNNNRLSWMMNHQTLLSPSYEFREDNGGAGISDERRIDLYLFSNRLNIKPKFINAPADLKVYSYELKASNGHNGTYGAFVTEAEILANELPSSTNFSGCNWATIDNKGVKLGKFYNPTKFTSSLEVTYAQEEGIDAAAAPKFAFLLLPADVDDLEWADKWDDNSVIRLTAHTNYGDITISNVTGRFDANMTTESTISLSKLYYNKEDSQGMGSKKAADTYVGFLGNAGTTRGAETGDNGDITATFDYNTISIVLPEVCDETDLDRALKMIGNHKKLIGETYNKQTITLCKHVTFENLDFSQTILDAEEETGVSIDVTGQKWTDNEGNHVTDITWVGDSKLDEYIPNTTNYVEGTMTANSQVKNIATTTVREDGKLTNYGKAGKVTVEEGGELTNSGKIADVRNYGSVINAEAKTAEEADQPTISKLYNYNMVINYATISDVKRNMKMDNTTDATIELRNNTNKVPLGTLGSIFKVDATTAENDGKLGIIKYTLNAEDKWTAGTDLANALNNFATQITVDKDVKEIIAPESSTFKNINSKYKNDFGRAHVTFEGNTTYTINNKLTVNSVLVLGEIALNDGVTFTVRNAWATGNVANITEDQTYALATDLLTMSNSVVDIKEATTVVAEFIGIAKGTTATINTTGEETFSTLYYESKTAGASFTTNGFVSSDVPAAFNKYFNN